MGKVGRGEGRWPLGTGVTEVEGGTEGGGEEGGTGHTDRDRKKKREMRGGQGPFRRECSKCAQ